ncbi:MAG: hypothetical protein QOJ53_1822 [Sphingomonadales bacterium]|jgi:ribonuclease HI|nr:hypothetical protein [Sphingomonadales bacterium]MEA3044973.1 hypothetical protein [Sphingomonadales bacterium]MEA3047490.1 hypothetical protein [Sphingomonadales bacterium]
MPARWLVLLATAIAATACSSTANINRFKAFADLGRSYEGAVVKVIDQAQETNIDADSQRLINSRALVTDAAARQRNIIATNAAVLETSLAYARLKSQVNLLSDYFIALGALASFDGDSAIGQSAGNVVSSLQALSPALEHATIGGATPATLIGDATTFVVSGIRSRRLGEELRRHGPVIDRQLALQSAMLELLARQIRQNQEILSERVMLDSVVAPYAQAASLPSDWASRRRTLLLQSAVASAPAEQAVQLSRRLRIAFAALAEGRMEPGELADYAADLGRLVSLIEQVRARPSQENRP